MCKRMIVALTIFLVISFFSSELFLGLRVKASIATPVHNINTGLSYPSIQESIAAPETVNGHTIHVDAGIYYEQVSISKSLAIVGEGGNATVVDGGGNVIIRVVANDVLLRGFTLKNGFVGLLIDHSNNSLIQENTVTDVYAASGGTAYAIYGSYCNNLTIAQNTVFSNLCSGILVTNSLGFAISNNYVHSNAGYGINTNASMNGRITQNDAFENSYDGIGLGLGSANCTVVGNNATENAIYGIWVESSSEGNHIYDNNIIGNNKQASVSSVNEWDNGFEGNYWSDYVGLDEDRNGIGDTPYSIDQNHSDNYPLMGPSMFYMTSRGSDVGVVSNSSIKAFAYYESNSSIIMHVLNKTESQTGGFCRIRIPHALMIEPYNASVDGAAPTYSNITLYDDGNSRWIYLSYQRSEREILIQGNPPPTNAGPFPYWILAVIAGVAVAMIIVAFYALSLRRKRAKTKSRS